MSTGQAIYLLSDATGETAEKMVLAALTQFRDKPVRLINGFGGVNPVS
jgi:regulator of PEP synthase PpsR (kinase-PPPase family)